MRRFFKLRAHEGLFRLGLRGSKLFLGSGLRTHIDFEQTKRPGRLPTAHEDENGREQGARSCTLAGGPEGAAVLGSGAQFARKRNWPG